MDTELIKIDINNMDKDKLMSAAHVIREGGLVAFPTETVYGLGANALNKDAVSNIFKAKGRPGDNPLIVHIANKEHLSELTREVSLSAQKLIDRFWPGPLTIILKKSHIIPDIITAGLDTVAVRMPSHPVALELIRLAGVPVAAPSANISGKPSPTAARHVIEDLRGRIDVIVDAGDSNVGLESTVVDLSVDPPMVLRPGGITLLQLKDEIGEVIIDPAVGVNKGENIVPKSPGMKYRHYSPEADMTIIHGEMEIVVERINKMAQTYFDRGIKTGILATDQTAGFYPDWAHVISMGDRERPETIAANLFAALRQFDDIKAGIILAEAIEDTGIGMAVMNRMKKAAGGNIIKV